MKFSLSDDAAISIQGYECGTFTIAGRHYQGSQVVRHNQQPVEWPVQHIDELQQEHLSMLLEPAVDALILGTGSQLVFPAEELLIEFYNRRIGVEIMDTAAACRTYNILVSEGRSVTAALIAI